METKGKFEDVKLTDEVANDVEKVEEKSDDETSNSSAGQPEPRPKSNSLSKIFRLRASVLSSTELATESRPSRARSFFRMFKKKSASDIPVELGVDIASAQLAETDAQKPLTDSKKSHRSSIWTLAEHTLLPWISIRPSNVNLHAEQPKAPVNSDAVDVEQPHEISTRSEIF